MAFVLLSTLTAVLAAEPSVAVTLSRRTAVSAADGHAVVSQVTKALESTTIPLLDSAETSRRLARVRQKDATLCSGKPACLKELLKSLDVPWLVLVSVAQVAGDKSLGLELFERSSNSVVEVESVVVRDWKDISPDLLAGFVQRVAKRSGVELEPEVTKPGDGTKTAGDAPVATTLTPSDTTTTTPFPPEPPKKSHTTSWVLTGVGAAALVAAGVMLGLGLSTYGSLSAGATQPDGTVQSELTGAEAQARADTATLQLGIAGGALAAAAGLGTAAILTW